jgi:flavin reductase (DIM6/NTAB) family NADH-FMN oxidoreductase RutF
MGTSEHAPPLLAAEEFSEVMGHFASGGTVVTTRSGTDVCGTTANAVCSLSLDPPMLLVCMNRASRTGGIIRSRGHFAVNVLSEDQHELAERFARPGGDFDDVQVETGRRGDPLLVGALATIECVVDQEVVAGSHTVFLANVDQAKADPRLGPLAYFRGAFGRLRIRD